MSPYRRRLLSVSFLVFFLLPAPGVHPQAPNLCGTKANGRYACADCSSYAATSGRGSAFEANVLRLRDSVKGMAPGNASFLSATFAAAGDAAAEDTVYGLATCLADAEASDCAACLDAAAGELPGTRCAGRRDMVLWYPQCLVRYDKATFFGVADTSAEGWFDVPNPNNFSDPSSLGAARERLNGRMLAAASGSPLRFAFGDERVTVNTTLHGLAQCTEDLTAKECSRCLASHVARAGVCCADMDGVRINGASCYLRYEFMAIVPGTPPSMAPPQEAQSPPPSSGGAGKSSSRTRKKTPIYIVAGAVLLLLCFLGLGASFCLWRKKRRRGSSSSDRESRKRIESLLQRHQFPRRYNYAQVKRMTRSFAHELGHGGNGTVYKGSLPDGCEVAVKMLKEDGNNRVDGEQFVNEVMSISRTSHVNVVTLLGFCLEVEGSGSKSRSKRGLVYEYMPNGSLERYTIGGGGDNDDGDGDGDGDGEGEGGRCLSLTLSWEQLFDVSVGIARGLEYLHRGCNAHIVHFDIKPHNILLDRQLRPKISDFGLAKLCPQKESTIAVSVAGARGTPGYIAPELISRHWGPVTSKSDVYSYGMMVLTMVGATRGMSSRTRTNNGDGGGGVRVPGGGDDDDPARTPTTGASTATNTRYFPEWLYQDLDRFCAEACGRRSEEEEADPHPHPLREVVRKMVIVGLWCIRLSPQDRPTMSRVVEMLLQEKTTAADLQLPPGPGRSNNKVSTHATA